MMSGIRGKNTKPELIVRRFLHSAGLRFRLHAKLPGKPDLVLPKYRTVVFVHGCFWHRHEGCRYATMPTSNPVFWQEKFTSNVRRDAMVRRQLEELGWRVLVIWACQLDGASLEGLAEEIRKGDNDGFSSRME
jgi:DNA mismatch endonuclease (patch repair protein)